MKVGIISPSVFYKDCEDEGGPAPHLFYLYSYLKYHNPHIEVDVLDLNYEIGTVTCQQELEDFLRGTEALLQRGGYDILGISCWSTLHFLGSMEVARLYRRLNPEGILVVGGYHATAVPEDFDFPGSPVDYVVKGDGEVAFHRIVNGEIPRETRCQVVQGVSLSLPEVPLLWEDYKYMRGARDIKLWMSRGCPFACSFCLDRLTKWRGLSPEQGVAEIERAYRLYPQAEGIWFMDPLFAIARPWRETFLTLLRERDLPVRFWIETRVDVIDEAAIDLMADMNFTVAMGIEAVVPRILALMKKTTTPERYIERFLELDTYMNERKVPHLVNQILNYPGETTGTIDEAFAFWRRYFDSHDARYTLITPPPVSVLSGQRTGPELVTLRRGVRL